MSYLYSIFMGMRYVVIYVRARFQGYFGKNYVFMNGHHVEYPTWGKTNEAIIDGVPYKLLGGKKMQHPDGSICDQDDWIYNRFQYWNQGETLWHGRNPSTVT